MEEIAPSLPDLCSALLRIDFLSFLPDEELSCLASRFKGIRAERGAVLCREGDPGDSLFIISSGLVRVTALENGQERLLAELKRGDFFGERALLTGEPRAATVTAALDVELFELTKHDFEQLLYSNPHVAYHISRIVSSRYGSGARPGTQPAPCYFSIVPSHPGLGSSLFAARLAQAAAGESGKSILVMDLEAQRGELAKLLGGERTNCPDPRLIEDFPTEATRDLLARSWYACPGGISVFELPSTADRQFIQDMTSSLSSVLELLKSNFFLVIFVLPPEINPIGRRILQLSDGVLFIISNSPDHIVEVDRKYEKIRQVTGPLTVQLKVGTSHLTAGKGLYRSEIRDRLKLSEMPQIWWSHNREKLDKTISSLSREICRRRVGLVLGAGASRGWAHLGVLRALEKNGIPIDMVAGSSIGAVVGALYAKTGSAEGAIDIAFTNFATLRQVKKYIFDYCLTGGGILKGNKILSVLQDILEDADFFDLKIPLSIVAVDMATGQQVVMEEGSVSKAVRASISSPGIFRPFEMDGKWYTDGALINPLPVDVIINKGANQVLASVVEKGVSDSWPCDGSPSIINTLSRSFSIMFARTARERAGDADVAIYPDVSGYTWGDFHQGKDLVKKGEEACLMKMDEIKRIIYGKE